MAKVQQMELPPGYQELLDKILSWFDNQMYPTWATRFFHRTRSAKDRNKEKTILPKIGDEWALQSAAQKLDWKNAAVFLGYTGYIYFTQKYSYCRRNGLPLPPTPTLLAQMYGLKICNPAGIGGVRAKYEIINTLGIVSISFVYKKTQIEAPAGQSFRLHVDAYYFDAGINAIDIYDWVSPTGDVPLTAVNFTIGVAGRKYFHLVFTWYLDNYNADVFLDNFLITDDNGDITREGWKHLADKEWAYSDLIRKTGWTFTPTFALPYFEVVYLE